jgi:integrase
MLGELETADIYNFKTQMEEKVAPATVVRNMGYIRGLFKHFMDLGEIDRNPCAAVKLPKVKRSKQAPAMTREEIIKVLDFTKKNKHPLYPFIFLAYQTGARSSELKELRISDFDLGNHTVTIARSLDPKEGIVPTKDGEPRTVPLNSATVEFVRELIAGRNRSERLLPHYKPFYRGDGAKHLRQIQKDLGIEPNNFHSIRASFVTHLLMADVPMSVVQRLVGHSEPKTTDEYVRMCADFTLFIRFLNSFYINFIIFCVKYTLFDFIH